MSGTVIQQATLVSYGLLVVASLLAARRRVARPWAAAGLSWALNGFLFYVAYLVVNNGVLDAWLVDWSAVTRLHGIFLAGGGLLAAGIRGK